MCIRDRLDIKGLKQGARVEVAGKRNPTDFALWKFSPKDAKRDMEWDSPWAVSYTHLTLPTSDLV